jgi:hypothetical protein
VCRIAPVVVSAGESHPPGTVALAAGSGSLVVAAPTVAVLDPASAGAADEAASAVEVDALVGVVAVEDAAGCPFVSSVKPAASAATVASGVVACC